MFLGRVMRQQNLEKKKPTSHWETKGGKKEEEGMS